MTVVEHRRMYILHHLHDFNDLPAMERWFWNHHAPEVMRGSRLNRYLHYRTVPMPEGADAYGFINYCVHEVFYLYSESEGMALGNGGLSMTPEPAPMTVAVANVGGDPTNDFSGAGNTLNDATILRWMVFLKYPEGVPVDECEDWYVNVHAKETLQQSGLTRFFSFRTVKDAKLPPPKGGQKPFTHPQTRLIQGWDRVAELWYENARGWRQSVIDRPPSYTPPPWGGHGTYPFFKPGTDFVGTFILERPADDYVRDLPPSYV
jgi:hypothetical protein